ncbi:hypothetical protein O1Q96_02730 [Streptomyces sp. Qhu-G9]|uniref:hypothetical protein n=1 Tax=Streptomyces sp. Qhu-G9 TaxID=3452799 RepID=UPI0022AC1154|nr:hypothetical protein [Streptomyces aurantiacus]WAU78767.1 hypothetical protein O1Q96_02730 [Streptomyces aurantiacus]
MTMTTLRIPVRATVRAAGLVDVPAVVRLITQPRAQSPFPAPVADGPAMDWEQAQRAMRLMLAHHALEEGEVWVAERDDGMLLAAGIWLPPGSGTELPGPHLRSLLSRELDTCLPDHAVLPSVLKEAGPDEPHWTLLTVCAPDDTEAWDRAVVADLLAPGLRTVDDQGAAAVAITLSARHGDQLRPLGFRRPREVSVAPGASVWLTTRHAPGRTAGCPNPVTQIR